VKANIGTDLEEASFHLKRGGLVAIPTETVYGLAANALNASAVVKIFEAKKRPGFDPLIVHIGRYEQIAELAESFPQSAARLTEAFWPGPLTLILPKRPLIPDIVTSGLSTVGIRMPAHRLTLELLSMLPFPLAAPSANPFGYISPTTADHVAEQLGDKIDYILDGGPCEVGVESTIISFEMLKPKILRVGGLDISDVKKHIQHFEVSTSSTDNPSAPGMLTGHYAPKKPIVIGDIEELLTTYSDRKLCVLSFKKEFELQGEVLSSKGDLREAARNLFAAMRRLDSCKCDLIVAEKVPEEGLGLAINDRLKRAAASRNP